MWQKEKAVQAIKYKNNIGYAEARKLVESEQPGPNHPSYANKVKSVASIACQTYESSFTSQTTKPTLMQQPKPDSSKTAVNITTSKNSTSSQTTSNSKPNIVRPKDTKSKADQTKTKTKKDKEALTSNREKKGNRFHALRNIDLELALHAEEDDGLDELMEVVPETQLSHHPAGSKP